MVRWLRNVMVFAMFFAFLAVFAVKQAMWFSRFNYLEIVGRSRRTPSKRAADSRPTTHQS